MDGITAKHILEAVRAGDLNKVQSILRARPDLVNIGEDDYRDSLCGVVRDIYMILDSADFPYRKLNARMTKSD